MHSDNSTGYSGVDLNAGCSVSDSKAFSVPKKVSQHRKWSPSEPNQDLHRILPYILEDLNPSEENYNRHHVIVLHLPETKEFKVGIRQRRLQERFKEIADCDGAVDVKREGDDRELQCYILILLAQTRGKSLVSRLNLQCLYRRIAAMPLEKIISPPWLSCLS